MKIIFVRHCEPDYEHDSLTPKGLREAVCLNGRIKKLENVKYWYVSPLGRARLTAKIALEGTDIVPEVLDWTREFEGRMPDPITGKIRHAWDLYPGIWTRYPEMYDKDNWQYAPLYQGTNVAEENEKIITGLEGLLAANGYVRNGNYYDIVDSKDYTIVVFCHMAVSLLMVGHLIGASAPVMWHGNFCPPSGLIEIETEERVDRKAFFRVRAMGDVSHLYMAGEPVSESGFKHEKDWLNLD